MFSIDTVTRSLVRRETDQLVREINGIRSNPLAPLREPSESSHTHRR